MQACHSLTDFGKPISDDERLNSVPDKKEEVDSSVSEKRIYCASTRQQVKESEKSRIDSIDRGESGQTSELQSKTSENMFSNITHLE